jgi:hypothetical protein
MSLQNMIFLDPDRLKNLARIHQESYTQGQPFPHIVIDDFLPVEVLEKVLYEFPDPRQIDWHKSEHAAEKKLSTNREDQMGEITRLLLHQLNSSIFINFLEELTGIDGLIPDPHLLGGGLHQIERGSFLKIHADFNRHQKLKLDRRLNLLIYLNKDWQEEYGGYLELWNPEMTECGQRILPIFNRCTIFNTTDFSYHGHPDPLTCLDGQTRKSIALYYYTNGRPKEELSDFHWTTWHERPNEKIGIMEPLTPKKVIKKLIPPIFFDVKNYLQQDRNKD